MDQFSRQDDPCLYVYTIETAVERHENACPCRQGYRMLLAHRIRLEPNNMEANGLARAAGVARFAYNWALGEWQRQYALCKANPALPKPSEAALRRQLNAIKRSTFPWMLEVTKNAPQMAIIHLGRAFENFFAGRARYPTFRRKGRDDRFTISNDQFSVDGKRTRISKLGWVRMRESRRFAGRVVSATVSRHAGHWYASITVDTTVNTLDAPSLPPAENQGVVGVDLGITALATLSTGETFAGPKALRSLLKKLRRLGRSVSRKVKGSCNRAKARLKLAKLHERIANVRCDSLHKLTTNITRRFHTIVIEDLNVKGMLQNHCLARAIADMGFYELRRQLTYKAAQRGGTVLVADRWKCLALASASRSTGSPHAARNPCYAPSSKLCSGCGYKLNTLDLSVRQWICPACHACHDRDVNAAINLRNSAVSSTIAVCGGEGAGHAYKRVVKPSPMKQESNGKIT